jgi:ADP-heptose:LPS heptosyltransferase
MTNTQTARLTSLIGQTDLGSLAALFAGALFVVSGDSGPMHIASGAGARVVALFGPTNPDLTGPRGAGETVILKHVPQGYSSPWYGEEMPAGGWLENITPEEVITAIERHGWHQNRHVPKSGKPPELSDTDKKALSERKMKILFVTLSNIGDVILTTPVLMTLASKYPQAEVTAVVGPRAKGILEDSRYVHRLVIYNKKAGWKEQLQFLKEIRKVSYDLVVDLRNTAIPYLVRARKRSPLFRRLNKVSFRERHLEVLGKMGIRCDSVPVFDFFSEKDDASLDSKLKYHGVRAAKDWILIAPAAASELKTWKLDGFRDVVRKLLTEQSADILIVGDKREGEIAKPLVHLDSARVHNLAGLTTLRELAALIARASLLVANDSAVMHLGYELGCPVVAVFGPTHSEKYGHGGARFKIIKESFPCVPCESPVCRLPQRICLDQLPAEKVIEACREFLHAHHL